MQKSLSEKKLFLFDIVGTLAVGSSLYPGSAALLEYIASIGGKACFITNNSTKNNLFCEAGFSETETLNDLSGQQRVTAGKKLR